MIKLFFTAVFAVLLPLSASAKTYSFDITLTDFYYDSIKRTDGNSIGEQILNYTPVLPIPSGGGMWSDLSIGDTVSGSAHLKETDRGPILECDLFGFSCGGYAAEVAPDILYSTGSPFHVIYLNFTDEEYITSFNIPAMGIFYTDAEAGAGHDLIGNYTWFGVNASYEITNLEISSVPLPAGLPLLLAGLGGFGVLRRKRR